jgi:hypothetical protein
MSHEGLVARPVVAFRHCSRHRLTQGERRRVHEVCRIVGDNHADEHGISSWHGRQEQTRLIAVG